MRNLLIAFFILASSPIFSQQKLSSNEQTAFKQKVKETAQNTKTIISDFTQIQEMEFLSDGAQSKGKLIFKAPNLVRWEYISPYPYVVIFKDGKLLLNDGGKKSNIDLDSNKLFQNLNNLIVGSINGDMFDDSEFSISYFKTSEGFLAKFIPKDKKMKRFIASFELSFDKKTAEVQKLKMIEPSGDFSAIVFTNKKINTQVADSVFQN